MGEAVEGEIVWGEAVEEEAQVHSEAVVTPGESEAATAVQRGWRARRQASIRLEMMLITSKGPDGNCMVLSGGADGRRSYPAALLAEVSGHDRVHGAAGGA